MICSPILCRALAAFVLTCGGAPLVAQDIPPPPAPHEIPAEAFVSGERIGGVEISPDGNLFAYELQRNGEVTINIADFETKEIVLAVEGGHVDDFMWFNWAGPRRIIFSRMINDKKTFKYTRSSNLFVYDLDANSINRVRLKAQGYDGDNVIYIDPAGQFVLLSVSAGLQGAPPSVWQVPLDGSSEDRSVKIQDHDGDIDQWIVDEKGVVRMGFGRNFRGTGIVEYRAAPDRKMQRVTKVEYLSDEDEKWWFVAPKSGSNIGAALVEGDDGVRNLVEIDFSTGELGSVIFEKPEFGGLTRMHIWRRQLVGVQYADDRPRMKWLDDELEGHQALLDASMPDTHARIASTDLAKERMLVLTGSSGDPGALYLYQPEVRRLELFRNLRSRIDHRSLSSSERFDFMSRDGHSLHGFITYPKNRERRNLPLVVFPHDHPFTSQNLNIYDDWIQLLASRGYAVMTVNYRGSQGKGKAFEKLGYQAVGTDIQNDLDDARAWAVKNGIADNERICLLGRGFGGYAAMWGVLRNPELYRCAISYGGITDWRAHLGYLEWYNGKKYYEKYIVPKFGDKSGDLDKVSPINNFQSLTRPMLIAHGEIDREVSIKQFDVLSRSSHRSGVPMEFLRLVDGHGLWFEDSRRKFTEAMLSFLAKHNPTDVLTPETAPKLTEVASAD